MPAVTAVVAAASGVPATVAVACRPASCASPLSLPAPWVVMTLLTWTVTRGQGVCAVHSTSCFVTVLSTSFVFEWCPSPNATKNSVMTIQSVKLFPPTDDHIACGSFRNRYRRKPRASPAALRDRLAMIVSASVEVRLPLHPGNPAPRRREHTPRRADRPITELRLGPARHVTVKHETGLARTTNTQLAKPTGLGENPPARVCWGHQSRGSSAVTATLSRGCRRQARRRREEAKSTDLLAAHPVGHGGDLEALDRERKLGKREAGSVFTRQNRRRTTTL